MLFFEFIERHSNFDYFDSESKMLREFHIRLLSSMGTERPLGEEQDDIDVLSGEPARVLLFNDEVHTFEEVIGQIIKAIHCDTPKAEAMTWEVHSKGKAMIYDGVMQECIRVSAVLEEIALHTQIEV